MGGGAANGVRKTYGDGAFNIRAFRRGLLEPAKALGTAETSEHVTKTSLAATAGLAEQPREDIFEAALPTARARRRESSARAHGPQLTVFLEIGRASCRER